MARLAARRAVRAARPRPHAHAAAAPAGAALRCAAARSATGSAAAGHLIAARRAAATTSGRATSAHAHATARSRPASACAALGAPGEHPAAASGDTFAALAAEFQTGANFERDNGYTNVKGKRLFSAFLCDLLERAEAAQDALGLDAEALRWATPHARGYDKLRVAQRITLLVRRLRARAVLHQAGASLTGAPLPAQVKCGELLGAPHEPPVPMSDVDMLSVGPAPAAAAPARTHVPPPPPPPLRRPGPLSAAAAAAQGTTAAVPQAARVSPPPPPPRRQPLMSQSMRSRLPPVPAQPLVAPIVIAFDLETTGFGPKSERIIEVAIVDCETGEAFSTLVNPGRNIPFKVTQVTTITNTMVKQTTVPRFGLAAKRMELQIEAWASRRPGAHILLVGHNAKKFDAPFLAAEYKRAGCELPDAWRFVDTMLLAQAMLTSSSVANHKLATLHAHFQFADIGAHRAECDARMVQNLLSERALGKLEPDLHARLVREAFRAPHSQR